MKTITLLIFLSLFIIPSVSFMAEGDNKPYYCEEDFTGPLTEEQILECQIYEAHQQEIEFEDYDYIYKENGIWHGVIDVELTDFESTRHTFNIGGINTARGVYYENKLFISFTRDIEQLTEIKVNYDSYEYCSTENWLFGWRCGITKPAQTDIEKTIYDDEPGLFASFIASLNYANVDSPIQPSDNPDYDYEVTFEGDPFVSPMESLHIISFKYVLTEQEVSNVLADIQAQYDQELHFILIDDHLSLEEKQDALNDLNVEYAQYDIEYGEEMESLCENEEQCELENLPPPDNPPDYPDMSSIRTLIIGGIVIVTIIAVGLTVGISVIVDLFNLSLAILLHIIKAIAFLVETFIWNPLFKGLTIITNGILSLIFWW